MHSHPQGLCYESKQAGVGRHAIQDPAVAYQCWRNHMLDRAWHCSPFCYTAESLAEQFHWCCCATQQEGRALHIIAFTASLCCSLIQGSLSQLISKGVEEAQQGLYIQQNWVREL